MRSLVNATVLATSLLAAPALNTAEAQPVQPYPSLSTCKQWDIAAHNGSIERAVSWDKSHGLSNGATQSYCINLLKREQAALAASGKPLNCSKSNIPNLSERELDACIAFLQKKTDESAQIAAASGQRAAESGQRAAESKQRVEVVDKECVVAFNDLGVKIDSCGAPKKQTSAGRK